jgi:hypothetical protein
MNLTTIGVMLGLGLGLGFAILYYRRKSNADADSDIDTDSDTDADNHQEFSVEYIVDKLISIGAESTDNYRILLSNGSQLPLNRDNYNHVYDYVQWAVIENPRIYIIVRDPMTLFLYNCSIDKFTYFSYYTSDVKEILDAIRAH